MDSKTREFYPGAGLPFITTAKDSDFAQINHFDVKREAYTAGVVTGMHTVYQLLFAVESGPLINFKGETEEEADNLIRSVIEDVAAASKEQSPNDFDRKGASIGFLISLGRVLRDHAVGRTWRDTMMDDIADANTYELSLYESALMRNADLVKAVTPAQPADRPTATKKPRAVKRVTAGALA